MSSNNRASGPDSIVLEGVPIYPNNEVPDGFASLLADIAQEDETFEGTPTDLAEITAEQAIATVYRNTQRDSPGIRDPYMEMLESIQSLGGQEALLQVRQQFTRIISENHSAITQPQQPAQQSGRGTNDSAPRTTGQGDAGVPQQAPQNTRNSQTE
jgi:hypothetical protein